TALPVTCKSEPGLCTPAYADAVASGTRMALEFAGYNLLDSELINAEMRRRATTTEQTTNAQGTVESTWTETSGGMSWSQLAPPKQRDLLVALGVQGILHTILTIGLPRGMASQRTVTVAVAVTRLDNDRLAWSSQCSVETGDYHST